MNAVFLAGMALGIILGALPTPAPASELFIRGGLWTSCHLEKCYQVEARAGGLSSILPLFFVRGVKFRLYANRFESSEPAVALVAERAFWDQKENKWNFVRARVISSEASGETSAEDSVSRLHDYVFLTDRMALTPVN